MTRSMLLGCGIASSMLYVAMNVFIPMLDNNYNQLDQTVRELSAIGATTRSIWVGLAIVYVLLVAAFTIGSGFLRVATGF